MRRSILFLSFIFAGSCAYHGHGHMHGAMCHWHGFRHCSLVHNGQVMVDQGIDGRAHVRYQMFPNHVYMGPRYDPFGLAERRSNGVAYDLQQQAIDDAYSAARAGAYMAESEREKRLALERELVATEGELERARLAYMRLKEDKKTGEAQLATARSEYAELKQKYDELIADYAAAVED